MADNTEQRPQAAEEKNGDAHAEKDGHEKKKPIGTLESVINESSHLIKAGLQGAAAAGMPWMLSQSFPKAALDVGTWTAANIAGDAISNYKKGKKTTMGDVANSSAVATATSMPLHYMFNAINKIPLDGIAGYVGRAAALGGIAYPLFNGMYLAADYIIKKRTFKGIGRYLKDNYWPLLKQAWKYVLPFSLLNVFTMPAWLQIPIGSAITTLYVMLKGARKEDIKEHEKRDKTPYLAAASNVLYKLGRSLIYSPLKALYEIAKPSSKPSAPTTQAAPAPAH